MPALTDLRRAVLALIGGGRGSVWATLLRSPAHVGASNGQPTAKSRVPVSLSVVTLVIEIGGATAEAAEEYGRESSSVPDALAGILEHLSGHPDDDVIGWWTGACDDWVARAQAALGLSAPGVKWIRGVACPGCGQRWAAAPQDGEVVRTPAIAVIWASAADDWAVHSIHCRACGQAWSRDHGELADLAYRILDRLESDAIVSDTAPEVSP